MSRAGARKMRGACVSLAFAAGVSAVVAPAARATATPARTSSGAVVRVNPPTEAACRRLTGGCVTPQQLRAAYGVDTLIAGGVTGKGVTIGIVDAFGSPTLSADLAVYDRQYGLPPLDLQVVTPVGTPPPFSSRDDDMAGWAEETTLDVEAAHTIAPDAKILLVVTPVSETEGRQGFPEIVAAENAVLDDVDVLSQSFGATEETFTNAAEITALSDQIYPKTQAAGIPVFSASGDSGPTDLMLDVTTLYDKPVTSWPASDPLVTAVGGTELDLDADGRSAGQASGWSGNGAGGGGLSTVFSRPPYQAGISTEGQRAVPDVALDAAPASGLIIYGSYHGAAWSVGGGTSQATPIMAGIAALATQVAGGRLGALNPVLYRLAAAADHGASAGVVDVTRGSNDLTHTKVAGYPAAPGYDLATGLGTIDAAAFVPALAAAVRGTTTPLAAARNAVPTAASTPTPTLTVTRVPASTAPAAPSGDRSAPAAARSSTTRNAAGAVAIVLLVIAVAAIGWAARRRRIRSR